MAKWIEHWGCERCGRSVDSETDALCLRCRIDGYRPCINDNACLAIDVACEPYDEDSPIWSTVDGRVWFTEHGGTSAGEPGRCPMCYHDEWVRAYSDPTFPADRGRELFNSGDSLANRSLSDKTVWRKFLLDLPDGWELVAVDKPWSDAPEFTIRYQPDLYDWSHHRSSAATVKLKGLVPLGNRGDRLFMRAEIRPAGTDAPFGVAQATALLEMLTPGAERDAKDMARRKAADEAKQARDAERETNPQPKVEAPWPGATS